MNDLISRDHLLSEIEALKRSPWYNAGYPSQKVIREDAIAMLIFCIKTEPSAWVSVKNKLPESEDAKQHLEVLEELRDEKSAWLSFYKEHGKVISYDEAKALINALDFAINFIRWGIGGKML